MLIAGIGLLIPVFIILMAFLAARSDAETQREYDRIRQEYEQRMALKKQQLEQQKIAQQATSQVQATVEKTD